MNVSVSHDKVLQKYFKKTPDSGIVILPLKVFYMEFTHSQQHPSYWIKMESSGISNKLHSGEVKTHFCNLV